MTNELPTLYQQSKICPSCPENGEQPLENFYKNARYALGVTSYCKACMKAYGQDRDAGPYREQRAVVRRRAVLKREYGMTIADYDALLVQQDGRCAICGVQPTLKRLAVDHDHATGRIRGLLCDNCNQALGKLKDDPELLRTAIRYLENE